MRRTIVLTNFQQCPAESLKLWLKHNFYVYLHKSMSHKRVFGSPLGDRDEIVDVDKLDMLRTNSRDREFSRSSRDDDAVSATSSDSNHVMGLQGGPALAAPNVWGNMMGMTYPMVGMNMIVDPTLMSMNNYGIMPPMITPSDSLLSTPTPDSILLNAPTKEIIHCKSCTLFPPNPSAAPPSTRERPPGCRTVFVGGLPESMSEEHIREVFERCGEISNLRLSKKNFCHIRFAYEASVDAAIFLSGYRIRIGSNTDAVNTGRLHVDYAQARDDQYEWECRQRQLQREQRHRERMEEERLRPPSPPPIVHYTDHEASMVCEKIKQDDTFTKAVLVVITWLERGDCNKRNANTFYSMIQSTNSHVRRLSAEKVQYEEELQKARDIMKGRMQGILLQFSQIERLFNAACHKKVWDHFTKAQRKNIETWKKQSMEIKNVQLDGDQSAEKGDDEMDVSDEEDSATPKKRHKADAVQDENASLKEENMNLRFQLEAYKNEVDVNKADFKNELEEKEKHIKVLQQTLHGVQQKLIELKRKQVEDENKRSTIVLEDGDSEKGDTNESTVTNGAAGGDTSITSVLSPSTDSTALTNSDARLIGIISAFLNVHPFGAGLDYIWSYITKLENTVNLRPADLELLMSRFPSVFTQELVGIGANIERRWLFNAFKSGH